MKPFSTTFEAEASNLVSKPLKDLKPGVFFHLKKSTRTETFLKVNSHSTFNAFEFGACEVINMHEDTLTTPLTVRIKWRPDEEINWGS